MDSIIRITPNKEKALSILKMVEKTTKMIEKIDLNEFPSNVTKEYYEVIREMITIVLLLDGYKTIGEGAHKRQIEYLEDNYRQFEKSEITLIDDFRKIRNKVAYDGFFVKEDYIKRKLAAITSIIEKLRKIINKKLNK